MKYLMISMALFFSTILTGCCQSKGRTISDDDWNKADQLEYGFFDSSVAPEYHRSYSLTVTKTQATISVTCYGDELLKETYDVTEEQFNAVVDALRKLGIKSKKKQKNAVPCCGGTSEEFELLADGQSLFSGYQDNCEDKLSTMVVGGPGIRQAFNIAFPKPINEIVDSTRRREEI